MNVFIALKGTHFLFLFSVCHSLFCFPLGATGRIRFAKVAHPTYIHLEFLVLS